MSLIENKNGELQIKRVRFLPSSDVPVLIKVSHLGDTGTLILKEKSILFNGSIHEFLMFEILSLKLISLNGIDFSKWVEIEYKTSQGIIKKVYFHKKSWLFGQSKKQVELLELLIEKYVENNWQNGREK